MTTWPAGGYRNGESAQDHDDGMEFRTSGSEVTLLELKIMFLIVFLY